MTASIVNLAQAREERTPHWEGTAHCVGCHHEWEQVAPIGDIWVDCPSCGLPKGTPKHPFGPSEGDQVLRCAECDGEALNAYKRKGHFYVRCMGCGNDLTHAFYEG